MLLQGSLTQGGWQIVQAETRPGHNKVGAAKLQVLLLIDALANFLCLWCHALPCSRRRVYPPLLSLQQLPA